MSDQSHSWYIRGEGNQPAGPFTAEQLIQTWRTGRLDANTICWREGMAQWLPLSQVEPFASAIRAANVSRQATAGAARWPAPPTGVPSSPSTGSRPAGRRRAPPAWIGWAIAGGIAAICALVAGVALLLNVRPTNWGSSYTVDYKVASEGGSDARLKATVKGPAAKLAVILTDPKGESETQIIEKERMISNSQTVELPMQNPREGTYVVTVKTVEPEKVVWKKNIPLSLGKLAVADVTFDLSPNLGQRFEGYFINGIKVVLKKDGTLPVKFTDVSAAVDGNEGHQIGISSGHTMVDQQHTVGIHVNFSPTAEMEKRDRARGGLPYTSALFRPGERHWVKGKLCFGEDNRSLEFEKEFVAPQDKKTADAEASVPVPSPGATPSPRWPQVSLPEPTKPEPPTGGLTVESPRRRPRLEGSSGSPRTPRVSPPTDENPLPKGPLSGTWRASAGALFRIEDDGTTAKVKLISGHPLQVFSGELVRRGGDQDARSLSGTFDAVFQADAPKRHSIRVTGTLDESGHLHLHCANWPSWNKQGKNLGTRTLNETWARQE